MRNWILHALDAPLEQTLSPIDTQISYPDRYPFNCAERLVTINNSVPALVLTPTLCDALRAVIHSARRMERLESIYQKNRNTLGLQLDRLGATINFLSRQHEEMSRLITHYQDDNRAMDCPYSWADVDKVSDDLHKEERIMDRWLENERDLREEVQAERGTTLSPQLDLTALLEQPVQAAGVIQDETDWWLSERPLLPALAHHTYCFRNAGGLPAHKKFLKDEQTKRGGAETDISSSAQEELDTAWHDFDVTHWNRIVAQQNFDEMRQLLDERYKEWVTKLTQADKPVPTM